MLDSIHHAIKITLKGHFVGESSVQIMSIYMQICS